MKVFIKRFSDDGKQTLGNLSIEGAEFNCATIELPYKDNQRRISCIPKGRYTVVKRVSPKYGNHFHITNVPNRDWVLIHSANFSSQLLGCISVGEKHIDLNSDGLKDINNSKNTLKKMYDLLPSEFTLIIE